MPEYITFAYANVQKYLSIQQQIELTNLLAIIDRGRAMDNKEPLDVAVVNSFCKPLYEDTKKSIEDYTIGPYVLTKDISECVRAAIKPLVGKLITAQLKEQSKLRRAEAIGSESSIKEAKIKCSIMHDVINLLMNPDMNN